MSDTRETMPAPGEPRRASLPCPPGLPPRAATRPDALLPGPRPKGSPADAVERARDRLRRHALRLVKQLEELTGAVIADGGVRCPTCGRGTLRDEQLRLKAIVAALDRGGLAPGKTIGEGPDAGPVLVFPPGTTMMVGVGPVVGEAVVGLAREAPREVRVTRGDELATRQGGAA